MERGRSRRKGQTNKARESVSATNIGKLLLIFFGIAVVLLLIPAFSMAFGRGNRMMALRIGPLLQTAGILVSWIGAIGLLVLAFREDTGTGFCFLVIPFYQLYWVITRWDVAKPWAFVWLGGVLPGIWGSMMLFTARA